MEHLRNGARSVQSLDQSRRCAHRSYLSDFIKISILPKRVDPVEIKRLYLEEDLSAAQIGERFGVSKQMILARLRASGVRNAVRKGRTTDNFRYPEPPYGLKVLKGRLLAHPREMKVVRLIVEMRDRRNYKWVQIVEHLNQLGLRTRHGKRWNRVGVKRVQKRWAGKI